MADSVPGTPPDCTMDPFDEPPSAGSGSTRGCCWSTRSATSSASCRRWSASCSSAAGRTAAGGGALVAVGVPVALGFAALRHHQLPDHRRPDRGPARAAEQARALRAARPRPHRRSHGLADPPRARPGDAADRNRAERREGRGPARLDGLAAPAAAALRQRLLHAGARGRPGVRRESRPARVVLTLDPALGALRPAHVVRDRHRRRRARPRRAGHPHPGVAPLDRRGTGSSGSGWPLLVARRARSCFAGDDLRARGGRLPAHQLRLPAHPHRRRRLLAPAPRAVHDPRDHPRRRPGQRASASASRWASGWPAAPGSRRS